MKRFICLGINDDESFCQCCGKLNLKAVVWIQDSESGDIKHFGTTCATQPQKGFDLSAEIKAGKHSWKHKLELRWSRARRLYKERGGKMEAIQEITPFGGLYGLQTVGWKFADRPLYAQCLAEATAQEKTEAAA